MNGLEVLGLDPIPGDSLLTFRGSGDISHEVFDKNRIVVGSLGDMLFVGTF